MGKLLRLSAEGEPGLAQAIADLMRSTFQRLAIATGLSYLLWHMVVTVARPGELSVQAWALTGALLPMVFLVVWLSRRSLLLGQTAWLAGLWIAITGVALILEEPMVAFLYGLLPMIAAAIIGWPAAIAAEGAAALGMLALGQIGRMVVPPALWGVVLAGGAFSGVLGWTSTEGLLTVTEWSMFSYRKMRDTIDEARQQRQELKQMQADLLHANQELARITDRLKAMNRLAEDARRTKEEFVANVSHELRTPLNMIIGFSEMITQTPRVYGSRLPPALLADITAIQRNSQHLSKLVDDVLDLSQIEGGRMTLLKDWACLADLVEEAVTAVRVLYENKGLTLRVDIGEDIPKLYCDPTRVRQVILNLLSNAGRFTEQGGAIVRAAREEDRIVVSVADTGPGIAPEDQARLFEPFQQLDASIRRQHGGSGLGLAISKHFVEMHGGKMWLESELGRGTTFYFSLPADVPMPMVVEQGNSARRWFNPWQGYEESSHARQGIALEVPPRYVVMENGRSLHRLFERYTEGVQVVTVTDIDEAMDELRRSPARALVINAPSYDAAGLPPEGLADLPYGTPAILCWTLSDDAIAERLGVVRYLLKPISTDELLNAVDSVGDSVQQILLVDDDPEVLQLWARVLASAQRGYRVLQAKNGRRALTLLRRHQPDVVLLDLVMPGMDGFRFLEEMRVDPEIADIPVMIVSSHDPAGQPIVSNSLTVARDMGISGRELLTCVDALSGILSPDDQPVRPAPVGNVVD